MAKDLVVSSSSSEKLPIVYTASFSGADVVADEDSFEDSCSICLEPFTSHDPSTVTNCKHEYHLQCILEWSQRSKECPICWQFLVLKDPASRELLAAVESERILRSRRNVRVVHEDHENDARFMDDSDFEERIMQHFAAAASRARYISRRGRQRSVGIGPSHVLPSAPTTDLPDVQPMHTSPEYGQNSGRGFLVVDSPVCETPYALSNRSPTSVVPPVTDLVSNTAGNRDGTVKTRQPPADSHQRPSSSELLSFSESIKSRLSNASTRYKDSISKSTQGFKEKLLAHNSSVKELSRGVQREMSAGIAGVARMIERLDLTSKRSGVSAPLSSGNGGSSNLGYEGKHLRENAVSQSLHGNTGETAHDLGSDSPVFVTNTIPGRLEVSLAQGGN